MRIRPGASSLSPVRVCRSPAIRSMADAVSEAGTVHQVEPDSRPDGRHRRMIRARLRTMIERLAERHRFAAVGVIGRTRRDWLGLDGARQQFR